MSHVRPYQRLRGQVQLWKGSAGQSLALHTSLRWTTDLANKRTSDPQTYIYSAYFKLRGTPHHSELYAGRQFVFSGVGSAVIDGARLRYRFDKVRFDFFGGSAVNHLDPEDVRSLSDYGLYGGRIAYRPVSSTRIGLGWMLRRSGGQTATHRLGADMEYRAGVARLFGRSAFNIEQHRIADLLMRFSLTPRNWYVSAEYGFREPSVDANTVYSIIRFERYRDLRFTVQRKITGFLTATSALDVELFDRENLYRASLGVRSGWYNANWYYQTGYRGDRTGVHGHAHLKLTRRWAGFAQVNISRYRVQDEQVDRSDAYASSAGAICRLPSGWLVRGELQYLRNAVESNDTRMLLRVVKNFSYKPSKNEEGL